MANSNPLAQWEDSPQGWRVSSLIEDAPTNLGVLRNADLVEIDDENLPALSFSDLYETDCGDAQASNQESFGQSGQITPADFGGKLNDLPARNDNQNRSNSGPAFFSVADCSGGQISNVNEVQNGSYRQTANNRRSDNNRGTNHGRSDHASGNDSQDLAQSARINSPAQVAGFSAGRTPVLNEQKTPVLNLPENAEGERDNPKREKAESVAVECLKSSRHGWLIRLRLNSLPGKPIVPITYKTDVEYKRLRRNKKHYEDYKRSKKAEYQAALRKGKNDASGN